MATKGLSSKKETVSSSSPQDSDDNKQIAKDEEPDEFEEAANRSTIEKKLREKKPLPSVKFLLEHGDPDSPPPTAKDFAMLMFALFVTFVGSLVVWHFLFLKGAGPGQKKNWGAEM